MTTKVILKETGRHPLYFSELNDRSVFCYEEDLLIGLSLPCIKVGKFSCVELTTGERHRILPTTKVREFNLDLILKYKRG